MTHNAPAPRLAGFLKRTHYLYLLPVMVLAWHGGWLASELSGHATTWERISTFVMSLWLTLLWLAFWRLRRYQRVLGIVFLTSLGLYLFASLVAALYLAPADTPLVEALIPLTFWFPALYGLSFLVLGSTWGRLATGLYLAFMVVVSLPLVLLKSLSTSDLFALVQLYLSNAVMILVLMFLTGLIHRYTRVNRELVALASTDGLTQLSNRRQLAERLQEEFTRAQRYGTPLSIILLDIDHFKQVNDTHGHEAGDGVLREFAELLRHESRTVDLVGRWGGEEFLVLLPLIALDEATLAASRLRNSIEQHDFRRIAHVTASLGVTSYQQGDTVESLLKRADDALYDAKRAGRNRVAMLSE